MERSPKVCVSRTGRMEAKGCAKPVTWTNARRQFYWSLRARLARDHALSEMERANPNLSYESMVALLNNLIPGGAEPQALAEQLEKLSLESTLTQLRSDYVAQQITSLAAQDRKSVLSGVANLLGNLSEDEKAMMLLALHSTKSNGESVHFSTRQPG
jgi:acetyl-CoA carboxylase/biotin carboxylase 1